MDGLRFSSQSSSQGDPSLSLLLTGGATGFPLPPVTCSPVDIANLDSRILGMRRVESEGSMFGQPIYTQPGQSSTTADCVLVAEKAGRYAGGEHWEKDLLTEQLPGPYEFDLKFEEKENYAKNFPHCYSRSKDTLIVKDQTAIPFTFTGKFSLREFRVRVIAVFANKDSWGVPVKPCNNHGSSQGQKKEFIQCSNQNAVNVSNTDNGRHSILLHLANCRDVRGDGTELTENYTFNCRSSCTMKTGDRGINNRPLSLIFQLETQHGITVGRRVVKLKVAVSPGRDISTLQNSEQKRSRKRSRTLSELEQSVSETRGVKKTLQPVRGSGKYTVVVNSEEARKLLQKAATAHDRSLAAQDPSLGSLWSEYLDGGEVGSSSATNENNSQPDHYSLEGWLERYKLGHYAPRLEAAGFGKPEQFQQIHESDLDELDIVDGCHRNTIIHAAKRMLIRKIKNIVKDEY